MRRLIFIFIFLLGLEAFAQTPLDPEEYRVYSGILDRWYSGSNTEVVVRENTGIVLSPAVLEKQLKGLKSKLAQIKGETLRDFKAKNTHLYKLGDFFRIDDSYGLTIVSQEVIDRIFSEGEWDTFYKEYPGSKGIITFSRVGFDRDKEQALVQVSSQWEHSTGSSIYILLRRRDFIWEAEDSFRVWNSWIENEI